MFFVQQYEEGRFSPERGLEHNWHVRCNTGACTVLESAEYIEWLNQNRESAYTINFANGAAAHINPTHRMWRLLSQIAKSYSVKVFRLTLDGGYVSWTGETNDLHDFDAILIRLK